MSEKNSLYIRGQKENMLVLDLEANKEKKVPLRVYEVFELQAQIQSICAM